MKKNNISVILIDYKTTRVCQEKANDLRSLNIDVITINNNKINRGFAKAANLGIKKALKNDAKKILLLNPDVRISRKQILTLSNNNLDISSPVLKFERKGKWIFDFGGKVNLLLGRPTHYENIRPAHEVDFVSGAAMMIDQKVFHKIGFFDEQYFMYFEDVDFCLRAKKAGFKVGVDEKVTVEHQIKEHRVTNDHFKKITLLKSNEYFTDKYTPTLFKPLSKLYILFLKNR